MEWVHIFTKCLFVAPISAERINLGCCLEYRGSWCAGTLCIASSREWYEIGGARGVMVIVVGNGHGETSSNPGPS